MSTLRSDTLQTLDGSVTRSVSELVVAGDLTEITSNRVLYAESKTEMEGYDPLTLESGQVFDVKGTSFTYDGTAFIPSESVNIKAFGVKGDGTTDDTKAFQDAFTWAGGSGSGRELLIPAGRYILKNSIQVDGNQCNCAIRGVGSSVSEIIWPADATEAGFKFGSTTPIGRLYFSGLSLNTKIVSGNAALTAASTGTGLKQFTMIDVIAYGDGLLGTAADGYFSGGLVRVKDAGQPLLVDCVFYGVGGTKDDYILVPSGVTIESVNAMSLIPHLVNVSSYYTGYSFNIDSVNVPGIEGVVFDRCNGFCVYGLRVSAASATNPAYYPPQCNITNTQIEFYETGIDLNHIAAVTLDNTTLLQHPDATTTGVGIAFTDVKTGLIRGSYIQARPGNTLDGIRILGASEDILVGSGNDIEIPSGNTAIVFEGSSSNCRQFHNNVKGGGLLYVNSSTQSKTNSAVPYKAPEETSVSLDGGVILKQGTSSVTVGTNGEFTINWFSGFPNTLMSVTACSGEFGAYSGAIALGVANTTGFTGQAAGVNQGVNIRVNYTAVGS